MNKLLCLIGLHSYYVAKSKVIQYYNNEGEFNGSVSSNTLCCLYCKKSELITQIVEAKTFYTDKTPKDSNKDGE